VKNIPIFILLAIFCCSPCLAGQTTAYIKDEKIIIEDSKGRKKISAYSKDKNRSIYNLKRWCIQTEDSPLDEAIKVFKNKAQPKYKRTILLINKKDNTQSVLIEYIPNQREDKVVFSPDENFMYFLDASSPETNIIYGINLTTNERFVVSSGVDFDILTCPSNKNSYIVVKKDAANQMLYYVYNLDRQQEKILTGAVSLEDIAKYICY
jgi:hypothetical protein